MIRSAAAFAAAAYLVTPLARVEAPAGKPFETSIAAAPTLFRGGSPVPPERLPPPRTCAQGQGDSDKHHLPGQVNGDLVKGAAGLRRLRSDWGDALIFVRGGTFDRADLRKARLHNICFVGTSFVGSDWRGADAVGVGFFSSDLTGSNLAGAKMTGITFSNLKLERVDARGVDFSGGQVSGSEFGSWEGLRLDGANLSGFRFNCHPISGSSCGAWGAVSLRGANVAGAALDGFFGGADWSGARFNKTRIRLAQLAELTPARIDGDLIVHENPAEVTLSAADYRWLREHIGLRQEAQPMGPVKAPAPWMRPGAEALFVAPRIAFDAPARRSALYRRLMPAILAGAISYVRVKVNRDGSVTASGSALGGNGHMCDISAKGLRLGKDGWYSAWAEPFDPPNPPPAAAVRVIRFQGERAEVFEGGHPDETVQRDGFARFVMCGARAGFEEMIRVPVPPDAAHKLWYQAGLDAG